MPNFSQWTVQMLIREIYALNLVSYDMLTDIFHSELGEPLSVLTTWLQWTALILWNWSCSGGPSAENVSLLLVPRAASLLQLPLGKITFGAHTGPLFENRMVFLLHGWFFPLDSHHKYGRNNCKAYKTRQYIQRSDLPSCPGRKTGLKHILTFQM